MPVWLEVIVAWAVIVGALHIAVLTILRKKGYFRWLGNLYDSEAYRKGYEDARKHETNETVDYTIDRSALNSYVLEHGIEDNRYK